MGDLIKKQPVVICILFLVLKSCVSADIKANKLAWAEIASQNNIIAFRPNVNIESEVAGDFYLFNHKNGKIWVSAFHNPKWPHLYVALRKENKSSFLLTPSKITISSKILGDIPFIEASKKFKNKYKTLRYRIDLSPPDYQKLVGDTLKVQIEDSTYHLIGFEKSIGSRK